MIKVLAINIEDLEDAGCNNGNYPKFFMTYDDNGKTEYYEGLTCRCHKGCSNTCRLPEINQTFKDTEELFEYMES